MTFPSLLTVTITIDGTNVTSYVKPESLKIDSALSHKNDSIRLKLENAGALSINEWDEIIVTDNGTKIFGGYILDIGSDSGSGSEIDIDVSGAGYSVYFDKVLVTEDYSNTTVTNIISNLFSIYLSGFDGTTYVDVFSISEQIRFGRITLRKCLEILADLVRADWYIDYDKNLHFFSGSTEAASFSLSDNPDLSTTFPFSNYSEDVDGSKLANRVTILGGSYFSTNQTVYKAGNGVDVSIPLNFQFSAPEGEGSILVYRNTGNDTQQIWEQLTVKVAYIDTLENETDVLYYYQEQKIETLSPWPNLQNAAKVIGRYKIPLRLTMIDSASYSQYGLYFDAVISDQNIVDRNTAYYTALAYLAENAAGRLSINLSTEKAGLRAGQLLTLVNSKFSRNDGFLIQKVNAKIGIGGRVIYNISLGEYRADLIDLLVNISRPVYQQLEQGLERIKLTSESVTLSENSTDSTSASPYYFSENPSNAFYWGFGAWIP